MKPYTVNVPREPTPAMLNAAVDATGAGSGMSWENLSPQSLFELGYRALLAAAPKAEPVEADDFGDALLAFLFRHGLKVALDVSEIEALRQSAIRAQPEAPKVEQEPTEVTIFCPQCALPHVDEGEWATTRRHKTHQCQGCGHEWRPFPFATVGITHPAPASELLSFPYQQTFNAIADAVTWQPNKSFGISVEAFARSFNAKRKGPQ